MLSLKPGEKICIVTDRATMAETDNAFVEVAQQITGDNVTVYVLDEYGERPLAEVPGDLEQDAKKADVTMFVAQSIGEELETVRKPLIMTAVSNGAAHGHCPGFTRQMMSEGMTTDYNVVYALSRALSDMLSDVKTIDVTTGAGTNLVTNHLKHHPWIYSQPIARGKMANFPDGEIFRFPHDVNGTAVVDGCVGNFLGKKYGDISKTPVKVYIQSGMAVSIKCPDNPELEKELNTYVFNLDGKREFLTRKVGEFALGTNLGVKTPIGNMLQDEKCGEASHFAFGDPLNDHGTNAGYGCKGHIDCLVMKPTIRADGQVVMEAGQYTESVLRATLQHLPAGYSLSSDKLRLVKPTNV